MVCEKYLTEMIKQWLFDKSSWIITWLSTIHEYLINVLVLELMFAANVVANWKSINTNN